MLYAQYFVFGFLLININLFLFPFLSIENSTWPTDNDYDSNTIKYDEEDGSTTKQPDSESEESEQSEKSSSEEIINSAAVYSQEENSSSSSNSTEEILDGDMESEMIEDYDTKCLRCLCMTLNECKPTICGNVSCGKYMISQFYWSDAGKPRVEDGSSYLSDSIGKGNDEINLTKNKKKRFFNIFLFTSRPLQMCK